jgi:hypothetical protein
MTEEEEVLVYDAMRQIQLNSGPLADLVNEHGSPDQKEAFRHGVYSPAIKLQVVLGAEAMERGKKRWAETEMKCEAFFRECRGDAPTGPGDGPGRETQAEREDKG